MPVVRAHTYAVEPADVEEFLARRASLIGTVRETQPGLTRALLLKLEDGTYCDIWHWETAAQMAAAFAAIDTFPDQLSKPVADHFDFEDVMPPDLMRQVVECINGGRTC